MHIRRHNHENVSMAPRSREQMRLLKALFNRSGDRAGGRRFHVAGPLTAKLRCPVAVRARGTTRVLVAADHRC